MKKDNGLIKFVNVIGQIIAFFTVALWFICLLNGAIHGFTGNYFLGDAMAYLEYIKYWATLIALALSGLELALRNALFFIIYALLVAGCVILLCFPGVFNSLVGMAGLNAAA